MEVLQKLTLYDLLGYALPGCVLLFFLNSENAENLTKMEAGGVLLFIAFGFLTGIMISEIMRWMEMLIGKFFGKKQWNAVWNKYALSCERMERALKKAHILDRVENAADNAIFSKYKTAIYADIQTDSKYSRIHNYASLALLCKNMFFVTTLCMIDGIIKNLLGEGLFGAIGLCCFGIRWQRFSSKKIGYAICWFLEKYDGDEMPETVS